MAVDIVTYRARIGRFVPRKRTTSLLHTKVLRLHVRGMFGSVKLLTVAIVMFMLLTSAGDVEVNPGPTTNAEKIDKLQRTVESLVTASTQNQLENSVKLDQINSGIAALGVRVTNLELKAHEITNMQVNLSTVEATVHSIKCDSVSFRDHLSGISSVVDDMENRMRRNNLIFKGLPEIENESWNDAKTIVTGFAREILGIEMGEIERAHRLGRKRPGSSRPIIVKFLRYQSKEEVLKNGFKLKNVSPQIRISEDFSDRVRIARQNLWEFAEQFRNSGAKYKISYNKLHSGTATYVYDAASDSVVLLRAPHQDGTSNN